MSTKVTQFFLQALLLLTVVLPVGAQGANFDLSSLTAASGGSTGNTSLKTGTAPGGASLANVAQPTSNQRISTLPVTCTAGLARVFGGLTGYGGIGYGYNGGYGSYGASWSSTPPGDLSNFNQTIPGSTFSQEHPLRSQVLVGDSNLYNQINSDYGNLGGNYPQLASQAFAIENQEETYAAQNGGFITRGQQAQLDQEESALGQQINSDYSPSAIAQNGGTGF
jgi:hypothetical protein